MGYFQPQRRSASSTVELNPDEFGFIAPLFVANGVPYKALLDVFQDGGIRSWMVKVRSSDGPIAFFLTPFFRSVVPG